MKGRGAGRQSLINELVAGNIAAKFGLPIAPFEIVYVSPSLIESPSTLNLFDLGHGCCFGSKMVPAVDELSFSNIRDVDASLRLDIIMFDWWVKNGDRSLTEYGGNPNLLWTAQTNKLTVIDHNIAFDSDVDLSYMYTLHVFREEIRNTGAIRNYRTKFAPRFDKIMADWDEIVDKIPNEWFFNYSDPSICVQYDLQGVKETLSRYEEEEFWK